MSRVKCFCIDDSNRPKEIPKERWPVKEREYHIIHIYVHHNQNCIQGVDLAEIELDETCKPYETYKLSRFAIPAKELHKLFEMIKNISETKNLDINVDEFCKKLEEDLTTI